MAHMELFRDLLWVCQVLTKQEDRSVEGIFLCILSDVSNVLGQDLDILQVRLYCSARFLLQA